MNACPNIVIDCSISSFMLPTMRLILSKSPSNVPHTMGHNIASSPITSEIFGLILHKYLSLVIWYPLLFSYKRDLRSQGTLKTDNFKNKFLLVHGVAI